jgi:hypothetical protein
MAADITTRPTAALDDRLGFLGMTGAPGSSRDTLGGSMLMLMM